MSSSPSPPEVAAVLQENAATIAQLKAQLLETNRQGQELQQRYLQLQSTSSASVERARSPTRSTETILKGPQPPSFHGAVGFEVDSWRRSIEMQFTYYGETKFPTDRSKVRFAAMYFAGAAAEWWANESKAEIENDWSRFVECLHGRFRPIQAAETARIRLGTLKQKGNVSAYANLFQSILVPIKDMSVADQIHQFRMGLHPELSVEVLKAKPLNLHQAMDAAVVAEAHRAPYGRYGNNGHSRYGNQTYSNQASSSTSSTSSGQAPMELSHLNGDPNLSEYLYDPREASPQVDNSTRQPSTSDMNQLLAMMGQVLAINQSGSGRDRHGDTRVPGISPAEYQRCRENNLCLKCKKPGHIARNCTPSGRPPRPLNM